MLDREKYGLGGALSKIGKYASKKLDEAQGITKDSPGRVSEDRGIVVGKARTKAYKNTEQIKGGAKGAVVASLLTAGASKSWKEENASEPTKKQATAFEKAFSKAHNAGKETFMFKGKEYTTDVRKGKSEGGVMNKLKEKIRSLLAAQEQAETAEAKERIQEQLDSYSEEEMREALKSEDTPEEGLFDNNNRIDQEPKKIRLRKEEGGSMLVPPEMPVDTFTPEEQANAEESQLPDDEMEEDYMGYVLGQSLDDSEQEYLMGALESDPRLSEIFDKVVTTASEFSGAGEVEGPGTGVSDSIPARLSDGEFVMTEAATSEIGADNLQTMMDDAERRAIGGEIRSTYQMGGLLGTPPKQQEMLEEEEENLINQTMLGANQMPSLMGGRR